MLITINLCIIFVLVIVSGYLVFSNHRKLSQLNHNLEVRNAELEHEIEMNDEHAKIVVRMLKEEEQYALKLEGDLNQYKSKDYLLRLRSNLDCNPSIEVNRHRFLKLTVKEAKAVRDLDSRTFFCSQTYDLIGDPESDLLFYRDVEDFTLELQSADDWELEHTHRERSSSCTSPIWYLYRKSDPQQIIELTVPFNRTMIEPNGAISVCKCDIRLQCFSGIWQWVISCSQDAILWTNTSSWELDLQALKSY